MELKPPTYTVCPPPDIQPIYTAGQNQTTVQVTWTDPVATDDRGVNSYVEAFETVMFISIYKGKYKARY